MVVPDGTADREGLQMVVQMVAHHTVALMGVRSVVGVALPGVQWEVAVEVHQT